MKIRVAICLFLIVGLTACDKMPFGRGKKSVGAKRELSAADGEVVALVNGYTITTKDLNEDIESWNNSVPEDRPELRITTRQKKVDYLRDEMVNRTLLYQEALSRGLGESPEIQRAIEKTKQQLLIFQLIKNETDRVNVSAADIENYYNQFKKGFKSAEEKRVREIVSANESGAKNVLVKFLQGENFADLALQYSKAKSAKKSGDLGYITAGVKFKEFDEIVFSGILEIGRISSVFKGPDGYYLVKIEAERGGEQRTLTEMWDEIKRGLTFLKQQEMLKELKSKLSRGARIEIREDKIE